MNSQNNILFEIPDAKLPKLAAFYKEKAPWAPYMVSFVHSAMKWKQSQKFQDAVTLFSPKNSWPEDGSVIGVVTVTDNTKDIIVFTLDNKCTNLEQGLQSLDYSNCSSFYCVHKKHISTIEKFVKSKNFPSRIQVQCFLYVVSPVQARNLTIECPPNVYIKKLKPSDAQQIAAAWKIKFEGSENYIAAYIEINGGYGVFLKSNDELVSWALKHIFGHLAMLHTKEEHRRKGYSSLVTKFLSKEIAEEGHWPLGTVNCHNENSMKMFEKIGFEKKATCQFLIFKN